MMYGEGTELKAILTIQLVFALMHVTRVSITLTSLHFASIKE